MGGGLDHEGRRVGKGGGRRFPAKLGLHPAWLKITRNYSAAGECEIGLIAF